MAKKEISGYVKLQIKGGQANPAPKNAALNKKGYDATPAMPEECKIPGDSVASYRKYYIMKKARFATWKNSNGFKKSKTNLS